MWTELFLLNKNELLSQMDLFSKKFKELRDSIENFEKIRILRESGASTPELEAALAGIDYTKEAANGNESYFASRVKAVTDAIAAASVK